jgi:hypothetical protein
MNKSGQVKDTAQMQAPSKALQTFEPPKCIQHQHRMDCRRKASGLGEGRREEQMSKPM